MEKNKKLKILNIVQGYYPVKGGAELFIRTLSEYQANVLGYDVDVWTTNVRRPDQYWNIKDEPITPSEENIKGVDVRRFEIGKGILKNVFVNKVFSIVGSNLPFFKIANMLSTPTTYGMLDIVNSDKLEDYDCVTVSASPYFFLFYVAYLVSKKLSIPLVISPALHIGVEKDFLLRMKYL
ncbi:MAG: hypothetical protein ABIC57_02595, partial [bacterium]